MTDSARIRQLESLLRNATVGEAPADDGIVEPGMVVTVEMFGDTESFLLGSREIAGTTDIDVFSHVTNTAYWHAIHEVVAEEPDVCAAPYRAVVEYRRPIQYGEDVTLRWTRRDDAVDIALTVGDEVRAAALLRALR